MCSKLSYLQYITHDDVIAISTQPFKPAHMQGSVQQHPSALILSSFSTRDVGLTPQWQSKFNLSNYFQGSTPPIFTVSEILATKQSRLLTPAFNQMTPAINPSDPSILSYDPSNQPYDPSNQPYDPSNKTHDPSTQDVHALTFSVCVEALLRCCPWDSSHSYFVWK